MGRRGKGEKVDRELMKNGSGYHDPTAYKALSHIRRSEKMKKTLIIEGKLCGLNQYTKACRGNRYAGAQMKSDTERIITAYIQQQLKGVHFEGTVKLAFILFCEMICGKTEDIRINCTFGYITTIVGIVVLYIIG